MCVWVKMLIWNVLSMVCSAHTRIFTNLIDCVYITHTHTHTHTRYLHFANVRGGCHGMAGEGDLPGGVVVEEADEKGYGGLSHVRVALFIQWCLCEYTMVLRGKRVLRKR